MKEVVLLIPAAIIIIVVGWLIAVYLFTLVPNIQNVIPR